MTRRRRTAATLLALLALGVALTGCGVRPTGIIGAGALPSAGGYAPPITVYLVRAGRLKPVARPGLVGRPYLAIEQLAVRPTRLERNAGLHTEVGHPLTARLLADNGTAAPPGGELIVQRSQPDDGQLPWARTEKAQIACTAEAIPGVESIALWGGVTGWEGVNCDQFVDLLP
ncbi:hypothetical protein GCM10022254_23150 [Actinomadura meridiana]|uniref:Lipoprotein n=1 Tax=Actinomadura meridiana TaxID=559626 RepID=A0ABP8BXP6_9ACTN